MTPKKHPIPLRSDESENFSVFVNYLAEKLNKYSGMTFRSDCPVHSPVHGDNKHLGGYPLSFYVEAQIQVAIENLESLYDLCVHEKDGDSCLYLRGQGAFAVIRAIIEASVQALWTLTPNSRWERVKRRLVIRLDELEAEKKALDSWVKGGSLTSSLPSALTDDGLTQEEIESFLSETVGSIQEQVANVYELGAATGHLDADTLNKAKKGMSWVTMLNDLEKFSPQLEDMRVQAVWRFCSGLAHGKEWARFMLQTRHLLEDRPKTKSSVYAMSVDLSLVSQYGIVAIEVLETLIALYQRRTTPHRP